LWWKWRRAAKSPGEGAIGVDLGLKDLAALSTGERIEAKRFYRDLEPALAVAQRAGKGRSRAGDPRQDQKPQEMISCTRRAPSWSAGTVRSSLAT